MAEIQNEQQPHSFKRKLGNTTYTVKVHFSKDTDKTFKDRVQKLIINECLEKSEIIHVNTLHHLSELTGGKGMLADSPRCCISVKEKLAEMREKAYGQKIPEPDKAKNKEECL